MNMVLSFEESVKGTKKVKTNLFRSFNMKGDQFVRLVVERNVNQELNQKNVELAQVKEQKLLNKECL